MVAIRQFSPEQRAILAQMGIMPDAAAHRTDIPVQPGMEAPRNMAGQNLEAIRAIRAMNPVQSPVAAGTPTQGRLNMLENVRQFDEQMRFNQRATAPISIPGAVAEPALTRNDAMASIRTLVDQAIRSGLGWNMVESRIIANAGVFDKNTMMLDEAIEIAFQHYRNSAYTPTGELKPPRDPDWGTVRPVEDMDQIYQRLFPEEYGSGLGPFYLPPPPPEPERVWWNPTTWFR